MAIKFFNSIEVDGEVQGTSLDINGNADISGNLTGVDGLTMSGNLTTGNGNIECNDLDVSGVITGDGSSIDTINASNLATGTVPAARVTDATYTQSTSVVTATDWDTLLAPGTYKVASSSGAQFTGNSRPITAGGLEPDYRYGHVHVTEATGQGIQQTFYPHSGVRVFFRTGWSNGSWQPWHIKLTTGTGIMLDGNTITGIDNASEFTDNDAHIMTSTAIKNKIADNDNSFLTSVPNHSGALITSGTVAAARVATLNQNTTGSSGSCTGNAVTATTATNVTASSVSNAADYFGCFVSSTGTQGIKVASGLKYNPSTNILTAGKLATDTVSIVENAKSGSACMTITGAGAGNEANIALKIQGTAHGDPVKLKMKGEDSEGGEVGKGLLSFDPGSDTFSIGQSSSHNSMAIKIDNSDVTTFKNMAVFSNGVDITYNLDATNATGDTGALRCEGGASIAKKLYVGSTITGSADVIAYSDERLKKNVKTLDGKKVLEMRGVSFERTDSGKQSSGVIAQEMEKVAPELVIDDGSYKGVAYGNIVGYLIEAIKDQQKQIDELKAICNGCSK